jgi:hypothetical protein
MAVTLLGSTAAFCDNAVFSQDPECPSNFLSPVKDSMKPVLIQGDCRRIRPAFVAWPSLCNRQEPYST